MGVFRQTKTPTIFDKYERKQFMNLKQALIDNDSIRLGVTASDWKEAVKLAVEPLVESGGVKAE